VRRQQLRSAAHAARCTARHGVEATPNAAGANIACAMNVARHSPSAMWLSENRSPPLSLDAADDQAEPLTTCRVSGWSNCRSGA
jgi:hypothetical protein